MNTQDSNEVQVPDEMRVPVLNYLAVVTTPKDKANQASELIRDGGKHSIFLVLNKGDGWVDILVWIDVRNRADFYEHLKAVASRVQLKYVPLE